MAVDGIQWIAHAKVIKYEPESVARLTARFGFEPTGYHLRHLEATEGLQPDDILEAPGNLLTTVGLNRITSLIIGGGGSALSHTDAALGVGSSSTTATVADVALGGDGSTTTAYYQQMDTSFPTQSNGVLTGQCTYQSANADFAWNEWGWVDVSGGTITAGGTIASIGTTPILINHRIQSLGTKVSGAIWTLSTTITLA